MRWSDMNQVSEAWYILRLQALAGVARLLRIPFTTIDDEYSDSELEGNPYVSPEVAHVIQRSLTAALIGIWPVAHQNLEKALNVIDVQILHQLHLYNGLGADTFKGTAWELARLYTEWLPEDTEPGSVIGGDWISDNEPAPLGKISIKAEIWAFVTEALEGDLEAAANVVETFYVRQGTMNSISLVSHLIVGLAHRYSLNELPQLADLSDDDDG
jgi:hypothetical protein